MATVPVVLLPVKMRLPLEGAKLFFHIVDDLEKSFLFMNVIGAAVQTKKQSKSFFSICSVSLTISDFFAFLPFSHKIHPEIFDPSHIVEIICRS